MSKRLADGMKSFERKEGMKGRLKMALAADVGERMIRRFMKGDSIPSSNQAFKIAKTWNASEEEADSIAREFDPTEAKDTA